MMSAMAQLAASYDTVLRSTMCLFVFQIIPGRISGRVEISGAEEIEKVGQCYCSKKCEGNTRAEEEKEKS